MTASQHASTVARALRAAVIPCALALSAASAAAEDAPTPLQDALTERLAWQGVATAIVRTDGSAACADRFRRDTAGSAVRLDFDLHRNGSVAAKSACVFEKPDGARSWRILPRASLDRATAATPHPRDVQAAERTPR